MIQAMKTPDTVQRSRTQVSLKYVEMVVQKSGRSKAHPFKLLQQDQMPTMQVTISHHRSNLAMKKRLLRWHQQASEREHWKKSKRFAIKTRFC